MKAQWYINHLIEHKQKENGDDEMLKIIYQLDDGAYKPVKSHEAASGFNLFAREDVALSPNETFKFDTGVHVLIPEGYVGLVLPRSGYNCAGVATPTGVIDAGYTGSISVVLVSKYDLKIFKGNRIAQLIIVPLPGVNLVEGDVTGVKSSRCQWNKEAMEELNNVHYKFGRVKGIFDVRGTNHVMIELIEVNE